jgi:preprotein translocase subunit YajC
MVILSDATTLPAGPKDAPPLMGLFNNPLTIIMVGLVVMMILMSRGKKGEEKKRQDMLKQMKKGDEVQTIGGVIGKIVDVRDDRVQVKVDETANTKMWFTRNAIHRVIDDADDKVKG